MKTWTYERLRIILLPWPTDGCDILRANPHPLRGDRFMTDFPCKLAACFKARGKDIIAKRLIQNRNSFELTNSCDPIRRVARNLHWGAGAVLEMWNQTETAYTKNWNSFATEIRWRPRIKVFTGIRTGFVLEITCRPKRKRSSLGLGSSFATEFSSSPESK